MNAVAERAAAHVRRVLGQARLPDVAAAYLFGSCCSGEMRPDSDIDVAVIAAPDVWARRGWAPWHLEAEVARRLSALDGHVFDVSVLSPRGVRFAFEVIRTGCLVISDRVQATDAFVERIVRRYPEEVYRYERALVDAGVREPVRTP